jgi:PAS domain S-box-containing protein
MAMSALETKLRHQTVLVELSQLESASTDAALRKILSRAAQALRVERASFWSIADDGSAIRCVQLYVSSTDSFSSGVVLERAQYPGYFEALLTCRAIVVNDAMGDDRTREFAVGYFDVYGITSMLDVPVWTDGKLAGVLCLEHVGSPREWSVDEQDFARAIVNLIAINLVAAARSRAEERYRLVSRAGGDIVWEWDLGNDRVDWGDRLSEAFGHPISSESSTGHWWISQVHPADRLRVKQSIQSHIAMRSGSWEAEYRFRRSDGTYAFVFDRGFVTRDESGRSIRMTGVMQDVTQRKALEERVLLSDRMASLGTLAAGVAHEINNPLTYVKGNIEHVRSEIEHLPGVTEDVLAALDDAIMGADRMRRIVRDLTIFTRGTVESDTEVDLNRVVASSITIAENSFRHHAALSLQLGSTPVVRASEARLGQVVVNLVVNAAHAVQAAESAGSIRVTTRTDERGNAVIEVADDGIGIAPDDLARIFDPFFTTKPVGEGTGLGLSISHSIVRSLGGDIHVESTKGAGTTFRVTLPASDGSHVAPAPSVKNRTMPTATKPRVLVIDDERPVLSAMRRLLARDCDVEIIDSGRGALERVARERFDVVLCDVMMPDVSGIAVYEALHESDPALARRLVFMTGGAFASEARALVDRTSLPLLAKPIDADELRRIIANVARTP